MSTQGQEASPAGASAPAAALEAQLLVLGGGPGGYTAAFRAADLGLRTVLVERHPRLGGVCLNVGCIPSKAMLHVARVLAEIEELQAEGIDLGGRRPDSAAVVAWTERVVGRLAEGLRGLAARRKVQLLQGRGVFLDAHRLAVDTPAGQQYVHFEQAVLATGSRPVRLPGLPDDPRILDSTAALRLQQCPPRLAVLGGGIIGLEMACVFEALGSRVHLVEGADRLMSGCDRELVRPLERRIRARYAAIWTDTRLRGVECAGDGLRLRLEGAEAPEHTTVDALLVAVGRQANSAGLGLDALGLSPDAAGLLPVDEQMRTRVPHVYAIGDLTGPPMLAHKASAEGKVAAEVAAGLRSGFEHRLVPSVAYTDPEVAWVGLSEEQARQAGRKVDKGLFPWSASGRALATARGEGLTRLLFDPDSRRLLGAGIVGPNAGELIAEATLAIEMGADASDLGLVIHPHPTLSETVALAAEAFEGTLTELYVPRRRS